MKLLGVITDVAGVRSEKTVWYQGQLGGLLLLNDCSYRHKS